MTFQPFAVQCLTCGSRLRVSDPSILGTIVSCPKCHSMVQVDPPQSASLQSQNEQAGETGLSPPEVSSAEASSAEASSSDVKPPPVGDRPGGQAEPVQAGPPPRQHVAVGHSDVDSQAITAEAMSESEAAELEASSERGFADSDAYRSGTDERPSGEAWQSEAWQSEETRRRRQVALVASVASVGVLASLLLFGWFVRRWQQDSVAATNAAETIPSDQAGERPPTAEQPEDTASAGTSSQTSADDSDAEDRNGEDANKTDDPKTEPTADAKPAGEDAAASAGDAIQATADRGSNRSDAPVEPPPSDLFSRSPLDDLTDSTSAADTANDRSATRPEAVSETTGDGEATAGMEELPPGLAQYTEFLLDDGAAEQTNLEAPPTREEIELDAAAEVDDDPLAEQTPEPLNLKAAFNTRIAVASKGYPLADLTLLAGQLADVPIQIDWVSFDLAQVDLGKDVSMPSGWKTLGELLKQAAGTVDAELREETYLVVLTLSDEAFTKTWDAITDSSDFADSASLVATVNRFMGEAPEAEQLAVAETREEKQLALLAVESLRRMRGIEPKVSDPHFSHWAGPVEAEGLHWPQLDGGNSGPQYDTPVTLAQFLKETARRNGATAVLNWHDAIRRGAHPSLVLIPHVEGNAGKMLNDELARFGLQVRQVDQRGWWIGSESTYDRLTAMVWTPPLTDRREAFFDRIAAIMKDTPPDAFRMAYDETSDRALLLLPRFILRQLPTIAPMIASR